MSEFGNFKTAILYLMSRNTEKNKFFHIFFVSFKESDLFQKFSEDNKTFLSSPRLCDPTNLKILCKLLTVSSCNSKCYLGFGHGKYRKFGLVKYQSCPQVITNVIVDSVTVLARQRKMHLPPKNW